MSDQLVIISKSELAEFIKSTISATLATLHQQEQDKTQEAKPVVYRTRKYVKELLHTTYPTLDKYSDEGRNQLLHPIYFGRRVLYTDDDLNIGLPKIRTLLNTGNRKTALKGKPHG